MDLPSTLAIGAAVIGTLMLMVALLKVVISNRKSKGNTVLGLGGASFLLGGCSWLFAPATGLPDWVRLVIVIGIVLGFLVLMIVVMSDSRPNPEPQPLK